MTADALASLEPAALEGGLRRVDGADEDRAGDEGGDAWDWDSGEPPVADGVRYVAESQGAGLAYDVPEGALADATHLATDFLVEGADSAVFQLDLVGENGTFTLLYGTLPQCEGRVRLPLAALDGSRSTLDREGAWCKPLVRGDPVDPAAVERVELGLVSNPTSEVRWWQSPLAATAGEPPRLTDPELPAGPLLDEFGQSTFREWEGRTESEAELVERLREQRDAAGERVGREGAPGVGSADPESASDADSAEFDEWGGWTGREFTATGFFRTHYDGRRWWLVTPGGHPFWSTGLDVVNPTVSARYDGLEDALSWLPDPDGEFAPAFEHWMDDSEHVDYLVANLVRAFGEEWREAWTETALGQLRRLGFNTVGNWSDWEAASDAGVPYVRPLDVSFPETPLVYRDFPDVYHESFPEDAAEIASQLEASVGDPAMIGYFLGNEPDWRAGGDLLAAAILRSDEDSATRRELVDWLAERHGEGGLADAWKSDVTLADLRAGAWRPDGDLPGPARDDLERFSSRLVDRLYRVLSEACREVDPDHLNLGNRLVDVPREWVLAGMDHVDVLTCNCYRRRLPEEYAEVSRTAGAPILVGEFHFGAPDVGLPHPSLQPVPDQAARGDAYRVYVEGAAARPWCVGTHYFTMYDESALGRFDGENMNVGLFDVCHRPYGPLADAARATHERIYAVANRDVDPYGQAPRYLSGR